MSEVIFKKGGYWSLMLFIIGGSFIYLFGFMVYMITPEILSHAAMVVKYGLPLGIFMIFLLIIIFMAGVTAITAGVRGLISAIDSDNYERHKINPVFSYVLIVYGAIFILAMIILAVSTDYNTFNFYVGIDPDAGALAPLLYVIYGIFGLTGALIIYAGVRGFKIIRARGKNDPNIASKIFIVIFLVGIIAGLSYLPALTGRSVSAPTIPGGLKTNAGPFVMFGPYEDHRVSSTSDRMIVWWYTANATDGPMTLKYGTSPDPASMQTATEKEDGDYYRHEVLLTGLQPATTYYYTIPGFTDKIYNFTTGPSESAPSPFTFVCVGDTRNSGGTSVEYYKYINRVIEDFFAANGKDYAFTINVGDIDSSGSDLLSWGVFFSDITEVASSHPYQIAIGNHELGGDSGSNFDYIIDQPRYYSFNYSYAHFLMINNFDGLIGNIGPEQMAFIREDLKANYNKRFIIVAMHVPPLSTGDFNMDPILQSQLIDLFRQYKVDLVLTGHDHHYDAFWIDRSTDWNGTFYFVNGGGGSPLDHYIMTRPYKRWLTWYHNRSSEYGLYQHDKFTEEGHIYGELSHGFMEIEVSANTLRMTYYRWLSLDKFFNITGQDHSNYHLVDFNATQWAEYGLDNIEVVHTLEKVRYFPQ